ncbi:MAG: cyclic nucleotide-binding domain-containing protein [Chloroflexota bacterium]
MNKTTLTRILTEHPFFEDLPPEYIDILAGCAKTVQFDPGEYLTREGDDANEFFLIRHGDVVIEAAMPGRSNRLIETLNEGHVVGWSWLFEPYRWHFDVRSITLVRALSLDASCLRARCEEDHTLGYMLMKKFSQVMMERLQATRVRALNVYS